MYLTLKIFFQPKKKVGKKVAAAPLAVKKAEPKKVVNPLFEKRPRNFGIGKSEYVCYACHFLSGESYVLTGSMQVSLCTCIHESFEFVENN